MNYFTFFCYQFSDWNSSRVVSYNWNGYLGRLEYAFYQFNFSQENENDNNEIVTCSRSVFNECSEKFS